MQSTPRPTLRCLPDVGCRLATAAEQKAVDRSGLRHDGVVYSDTSLAALDHPLLVYARDVWKGHPDRKRIGGIDDVVLLKCKENQRWRGAIADREGQHWVVAAGWREAGSPDDFYEHLVAACQAKRTALNRECRELQEGKDTYAKHLLPTDADANRLKAEKALFALEQARRTVPDVVSRALARPGVVCEGDAFGAHLRALCHPGDRVDEMHLAIYVMGGGRYDVDYIILDLAVDGVGLGDWEWREQDDFPERPLPGERYWYVLPEAEH